MADISQEEIPPHANGLDGMDEDERTKLRPVDIDADVREMERRKRVEAIMNSKLFREELERIIETQLKEGIGTTSLMQQISDMMGVSKNASSVFKNSNCVIPINDIRGVEGMGYAKGEKILRCKLAAVFRLVDLYGWTQGVSSQITARLNQDEEHFLVNPFGMLFHEVTASSLIKVDMQGGVVEQGTSNFGVNLCGFSLHAAIHAARPDIRCVIHIHTPSVVAVSALKCGMLPMSQESVVIGEVSTHPYIGGLYDPEEKDKIARNLGPFNKVLLLTNQGAVCCGETIEEAFFNVRNTVLACETQLKLIPVGIENLNLLPDETRKKMYDAARKPPRSSPRPDQPSVLEEKVERKWRVGGVEFEALMRMLDNAGFRTGYIYRHPLIKGDLPRPKNDVELPPAVSSLGYLLEEEELYKQGLWKKLDGRRGFDRTRWLNSPNVYQKVEILETGTPDPKKITKWVAEASPTHASSTSVKIDGALQFVPKNTNPREFKKLQQQIKDYRRADKISAGPQSHILEGVTWEEAQKMQDATVTQTGDHVVLMGAASKGIIQRGFQHNAMMYKSPYAKNPFDSVTNEELDEYKKVVERKSKGDYDTDYSESEGLSSAHINKRFDGSNIRSPTSITSETEEESRDEPQVLRIETKHAPKPSQPEVVLSDGVHIVKAYHRSKTPNHYRTCSHAGLPKGSYCIPNPTHFHIAHYTCVATRARPILVKLQPRSHIFNSYANFKMRHFAFNAHRPVVTINIGNARSISLDISMQTLREFIYPFANALNLANVTESKSESSQTTFIQNETVEVDKKTKVVDYSKTTVTPLALGNSQSMSNVSPPTQSSSDDITSEFEMEILQKLHENLVADVTHSTLEETDTTSSKASADVESKHIAEKSVDGTTEMKLPLHTELELLAAKVSEQAINISGDYSLLENVVEEVLNLLKLLPFNNLSNDEILENGTNMSLASDSSEYLCNNLNKDEESNFKTIDNHLMLVSKDQVYSSFDEGISLNCSNTTEIFDKTDLALSVDEKVLAMSDAVYEYLVKHCFEIKELVLFPEVLYDENINKLFSSLISLYQKHCSLAFTDQQKSELRLKITNTVMKKFENDEMNEHDSDDQSFTDTAKVVSDKIFSISEFVSDIMDNFFNRFVDNSGMQNVEENNDKFFEFKESLHGNVKAGHSTPELFKFEDVSSSKIKSISLNVDAEAINVHEESENTESNSDEVSAKNIFRKVECTSSPSMKQDKVNLVSCSVDVEPLVTTFKTNRSIKSGNETYWIAISKTEMSPPTPVNREIINIDDIPLRPPSDLSCLNESLHRCLSPIQEEPRCALFINDYSSSSDLETADDDEYAETCENSSSDEWLNNNNNSNVAPDMVIDENAINVDNIQEPVTDALAGGDSELIPTYIAFERPEINVTVCDTVTFFRTNTINSASYVQASTVTFTKCNENDHSLDTNSSLYTSTNTDSFKSTLTDLDEKFRFSNKNVSNEEDIDLLKRSDDEGSDSEGNWMGYETAKF